MLGVMTKNQALLGKLRAKLPGNIRKLPVFQLVLTLIAYRRTEFPTSFFVEGSIFGFGSQNLILRLMKIKWGNNLSWSPSRLFDPIFYNLAYQDVSLTGMNPWLHYQISGRAEGRFPAPLLNAWNLKTNTSAVSVGQIIDLYFEDSKYWEISPSSYLDIQGFMNSGKWSRTTNPYEELIFSGSISEWVNKRTLQIGLSSKKFEDRDLTLFVSHRILFPEVSFQASYLHFSNCLESLDELTTQNEPLIVLPGLMVGNGTNFVWQCSEHSSVSKLYDFVSIENSALATPLIEHSSSTNVVMLATHINRDGLLTLLQQSPNKTAIVASNIQQFRALKYLHALDGNENVEICEFGVASRFSPGTQFSIISDPDVFPNLEQTYSSSSSGRYAIILDSESAQLEQYLWLNTFPLPPHIDLYIYSENLNYAFFTAIQKYERIFTSRSMYEELNSVCQPDSIILLNEKTLLEFA